MRPIVGRVAGLIPADFGPASDHALLACDTPVLSRSHTPAEAAIRCRLSLSRGRHAVIGYIVAHA
jgi:hypothetical protein